MSMIAGNNPSRVAKRHLISGVPEKTLGKKLAADHHVPAHGKNADYGQTSRRSIDPLARGVRELQNLDQSPTAQSA